MQIDPNNPPKHDLSQNDTQSQQLYLIPPDRRRQFFWTYVLMTAVGWVVGGIASIAVERIINEQFIAKATPEVQTLWFTWGTYVSLTVFALIFGADQAIVVRRYISGWWWLIATSFGWLTAIKVSNVWREYIEAFGASLNRELVPEEIVILTIASTTAFIFSAIWISFFQWIVLRRYTKQSWWWNLINSLAFALISFLVWLLSLAQDSIPEVYRDLVLYLCEQGLTALIIGIIPAIGFCRLFARGIPTVKG
jgi:hypothetical protein